jgi:hypothetical protein
MVKNKSFQKTQDWLNDFCYSERMAFNSARNKFLKRKTNKNKSLSCQPKLVNVRPNKSLQKHQISEVARNNQKKFWSNVKWHYKKPISRAQTLTVDDFYSHIKDLLDSNQNNLLNENVNKTNSDQFLDKE